MKKVHRLPQKESRAKPHTLAQLPPVSEFIPLTEGAGWTQDNFKHILSLSKDQVETNLYKMFGIPESYQNDPEQTIIQSFIEFQESSFNFARQFNDLMKQIIVVAILNDFISNMPNCKNSNDYFIKWKDKSKNLLKSCEITEKEEKIIDEYIAQHVFTNLCYFELILTRENVQPYEQYKIFQPSTQIETIKIEEEVHEEAIVPENIENEAQLAAEAIAQKQAEEETRKLQAAQDSINQMIDTSFEQIQLSLSERQERLFNTLFNIIQNFEDKKKNHHQK